MAELKDNTVSSQNQLNNLSRVKFVGDNNSDKKVIIYGNSITRHAPKAEIGWEGDWGMAASSIDNDFVHVLYKLLNQTGSSYQIKVNQIATVERDYINLDVENLFKEDKEYNADIIIFRIGENVRDLTSENAGDYETAIKKIINYLKTDKTKIILTTTFWEYPAINEVYRKIAKEYNLALVELDDLGKNDEMMAKGLFWHEGVAIHPGDKGMKEIANRIFKVL